MYFRKDVHELNLRELNQEQLTEESLINLAYGILVESKKPLAFRDIITAIEKLKARTPEEMKANLNQFYTDVNIDGRFMILAENRWGLREWYAIDQVEEEIAPTVKVRKKKAKAAVVDDEDEEEIELVDDFDSYDDDEEEEDVVDEDLVGLDVVDPDLADDDVIEPVELELEIELDDEDLDEDEEDEEEVK